jgi:cytochrome c
MRIRAQAVAALLGAAVVLGACSRDGAAEQARQLTGGEPSRGMAAIDRHGCGSCHEIPGLRGATGTVGPPLTRVARRTYLGGRVANSPAGMMKWIQHPQQIEPGTAMPEMNVSDEDARDIVAYLYTLE